MNAQKIMVKKYFNTLLNTFNYIKVRLLNNFQ